MSVLSQFATEAIDCGFCAQYESGNRFLYDFESEIISLAQSSKELAIGVASHFQNDAKSPADMVRTCKSLVEKLSSFSGSKDDLFRVLDTNRVTTRPGFIQVLSA